MAEQRMINPDDVPPLAGEPQTVQSGTPAGEAAGETTAPEPELEAFREAVRLAQAGELVEIDLQTFETVQAAVTNLEIVAAGEGGGVSFGETVRGTILLGPAEHSALHATSGLAGDPGQVPSTGVDEPDLGYGAFPRPGGLAGDVGQQVTTGEEEAALG